MDPKSNENDLKPTLSSENKSRKYSRSKSNRKRYRYFLAKKRAQMKYQEYKVRSENRNDIINNSLSNRDGNLNNEISSQFVEVIISTKDFPETKLSTSQMINIKFVLMEIIMEQCERTMKPQFKSCIEKSGWMIITCINRETAIWVDENIQKLSNLLKTDFKVLIRTPILEKEILTAYLPNCIEESTEKILKRIQSQNFKLFTLQWIILNRQIKNNLVELTFEPDELSLITLKENSYKIFWLYGEIFLVSNQDNQSLVDNPVNALSPFDNFNYNSRFPTNNLVNRYFDSDRNDSLSNTFNSYF